MLGWITSTAVTGQTKASHCSRLIFTAMTKADYKIIPVVCMQITGVTAIFALTTMLIFHNHKVMGGIIPRIHQLICQQKR